MKKKIICLSLAAVMSLGMATSAFARVGSGDVDGNGFLSSNDSSMIVQYTLDNTFTGTGQDTFDLYEANYDGSLVEGTYDDQITANDAAFVLQDTLFKATDLYIDVTVGKGDTAVTFTDVIDGSETIESFVDNIMGGDFDAQLEQSVDKFNVFMDNVVFTGASGRATSIRTELGWSKFENAVSDCITDQEAFDALYLGDTRFTTAQELKDYYATAKRAFAPTVSSDAIRATKAKFLAITGSDYVKVTADGVDYSLDQVFDMVADNNLQAYDATTINQLRRVFGDHIVVTATSTTGVENTMTIEFARR